MLKHLISAGVAVFFLKGVLTAAELPVPCLIAPVADAKIIVFHPSFSWELPATDDRSVCIQIAADAEFKTILDEDKIHSVANWYVPAKRLSSGNYWWRLRTEPDAGETGAWSESRAFSIVEPEQTFLISPETPLNEMRRISREASAASSARIQFAPGTYRLRPGFEESVFDWKGAENIILDGGGSRFIMEEPSAQLWKAEMCRNILIGNFSYEYDPRPHTIAKVVSVDASAGTLDAEFVDGFSETLYPRTVNQMFCYALNPADLRSLHPDRPGHLYLDPEKTKRTEEGLLRYFLSDQNEFPSLTGMQAGDLIVVCYRRWPLSYVQHCTDVTLFDIQLSRSEAPFFMGGGNTDMKFLNLLAPSENKMYPSPAGWVTGNDRHGPWIEGCFFEAIADDGPNITGNSYLIEQKVSSDTFVLQTGPYWQNAIWRTGDRLMFWNPVDGMPLKIVTVTTVMTSAEELKKGKQTVCIAEPVSGLDPGMNFGVNTHVYNLSCKNSGFVARNNRLICGRRFGFNIKADNVLVENNYFEGLSSSAIYLENAPTFWEGPACSNVVVQSNTIVNCGNSLDSAKRRRASGVHVNLWRYPSNGGYETLWRGHENILIRNNTIVDWESVGIAVDNARHARVLDNSFGSKDKTGFLLKENSAVLKGTDVESVTVSGNRFFDKREAGKVTQQHLN